MFADGPKARMRMRRMHAHHLTGGAASTAVSGTHSTAGETERWFMLRTSGWMGDMCGRSGASASFPGLPQLQQPQSPASFRGMGGGKGVVPLAMELDHHQKQQQQQQQQQQPCPVVISPVFSQEEIDMLLEAHPPAPHPHPLPPCLHAHLCGGAREQMCAP